MGNLLAVVDLEDESVEASFESKSASWRLLGRFAAAAEAEIFLSFSNTRWLPDGVVAL